MKATDDIVRLAKELCEKAMGNALEELKKNEDMWGEHMDLKLHDCAMIDTLDIKENGLNITVNKIYDTFFNDFCEISYNQFIDDCSMEGIKFEELRNAYGHTSSFYLGKLHNCTTYAEIFSEYCYDFNRSSFVVEYNKDADKYIIKFEDDDNISEGTVSDMLQVAKSICNDINDALADIITVYNLIKYFKDNQVEIYKDFIRNEAIDRLAE